MSFKGTIEKILEGAKHFLQQLAGFLPKWVKRIAPQIFALTTNIRTFLENGEEILSSDIAEIVTEIIPGYWDNELRKWALDILRKALPVLINAEKCEGDLDCMLRLFLVSLSEETDAGRKAKLIKLASVALQINDNNELPERRYDTYIQAAFDVRKEEAAA